MMMNPWSGNRPVLHAADTSTKLHVQQGTSPAPSLSLLLISGSADLRMPLCMLQTLQSEGHLGRLVLQLLLLVLKLCSLSL